MVFYIVEIYEFNGMVLFEDLELEVELSLEFVFFLVCFFEFFVFIVLIV